MSDEQYSHNTMKLIVSMELIEARIDYFKRGQAFDENIWLESLNQLNLGREILDRKIMRLFFNGGPKGINQRARKQLIQLMLLLDKEFPHLRGEKFDLQLKELLRHQSA